MDRYISRKELCKILGISYPTLERWRQKGLITGYSVGNKIKFREDHAFELMMPKEIK